MSKPSTKPPSGMRDFLPVDLVRRRHVVDVVRQVYERYGFVPLETPSIENLEILLGKYGEDEKLVYRVLHRGESLRRVLAEKGGSVTEGDLADQALRYDLTVPLARVVAQYELPKFFKRYQIQPVWRADRPGRGRFRELYQCDVDVTGTESLLAEAEVCGAGSEVLTRLGFSDFTLWVNHRELLRAMIRGAGIEPAREGTALVAVDKLDKIGREAVAAELATRGITASSADKLLDLVTIEGDDDRALTRLHDELASDAAAVAAIASLRELFELLAATPAKGHARFSAKLARGLGYYTGPIFEVTVPDLPSSIAGGGRYDELVGVFGKHKVPAVGLSLGLERILVVMSDRAMYPELPIGPDVLLCWRDVPPAAALAAAHALREGGLRIETYPEPVKLAKQLQYADQIAARWAAIFAPSEHAAATITLKHLESGEQRTVALSEANNVINQQR